VFDPTHLMTQAATLHYRTTTDASAVDDYGNPQPTETTAATVCHVQPLTAIDSASGETVGLSQIESDTRVFYMPPDTNLDGLDAIDIDGVTFEVVGPPSRWFHPVLRVYLYAQAHGRRAA
jgi:hypothetical protein